MSVFRAREIRGPAKVPIEWSYKVTPDGKKYLVSTASEEVKNFMSTCLRQTGADSLANELFVRGTSASLDMPSAKAAEARDDKDWEPCFKCDQLPDLFRDSEDLRAIAKMWRDPLEQSATAHSWVMEALKSKLVALLEAEESRRKKSAYARSNTTLENQSDVVRRLQASYEQQCIGADIHRAYLDTLTAAASDWVKERTMYALKMKRCSVKNSSESKVIAARTRYFPAVAKYVIAMGMALATKKSLRDLCESGRRLQQIRGVPDSVQGTWEDRLTYYKEEVSALIRCQKEAKACLNALSEALGLDMSEVESLKLEDLEHLSETEDKEAFRTQISAIAESKRPKVRPARIPRPIALIALRPTFDSWDGVAVEELLPPDLRATARAGNKAVQRYLSSIGVDWKGLSTERGKPGVARQTTHVTGESGDGKVTPGQMIDLDATWQLVTRARRPARHSDSRRDSTTATIGAETDETIEGKAERRKAWNGYWPKGTMGYWSNVRRIEGRRSHYEFLERPPNRTVRENQWVDARIEALQSPGAHESPRKRELRRLREAITRLRTERLSKLLPASIGAEEPPWREVHTRIDLTEVLQAEAGAAAAADPPSQPPVSVGQSKSIAKRTWEKWQAIRKAQFPELTITLRGLLLPEDRTSLDAAEFSELYDKQFAQGGRTYGYSCTYEDNRFETMVDWAMDLKPSIRPRAESFGGYPSVRSSVFDHEAAAAEIDWEYHDRQEESNAE